eukprot:gnl/TRDRNA2_/TRDRNA2_147947_c0_seq1.p1 gnl/TRDRNA2_/TRDRNA2_147947_c0~~gnl/TRDRNA2_/TRDRNA2_147947_c0_seq1.p1  ORF type:complete len:680 (+),score=73.17 gnl/TRDRNA2_/TRDRNA2_147947_c0_seq1:81-2120(+)
MATMCKLLVTMLSAILASFLASADELLQGVVGKLDDDEDSMNLLQSRMQLVRAWERIAGEDPGDSRPSEPNSNNTFADTGAGDVDRDDEAGLVESSPTFPGARIDFSGGNYYDKTKRIQPKQIPGYSGSGRSVKVRMLSRGEWSKTLRCSGISDATCEECTVPESNTEDFNFYECWNGYKGTGKAGSVIRGLRANSSTWTRHVLQIHVSCPTALAEVIFSMEVRALLNASLRMFWDGVEMTDENGFKLISGPSLAHWNSGKTNEKYTGQKFESPLQSPVDYTLHTVGSATIPVTHKGAHTLSLEFEPSMYPAVVMLNRLWLYMDEPFARCEDHEMCLKELRSGLEARTLRNSNVLQLKCLSSNFAELTTGDKSGEQTACWTWRKCLRRASDEQEGRLLVLLRAAGVGGDKIATSLISNVNLAAPCQLETGDPYTRCSGRPLRLLGIFKTGDQACIEACKATKGCKYAVVKKAKPWGRCTAFGKCNKKKGNYRAKVYAMDGLPTPWAKCLQSETSSTTTTTTSTTKTTETTTLPSRRRRRSDDTDDIDDEASTAPSVDQHCIEPETADVESWECDCFKEMEEQCDQILAFHRFKGFSQEMCIRAQMCRHAMICSSWKAKYCNDPMIHSLEQVIQTAPKIASNLLGSNASSVLLGSFSRRQRVEMRRTADLDGTAVRKGCN